MDKLPFKAQLAAAIILLVVMIPFFWHDEKVGYALGEDGNLTTEQECAQATNASWEDWIACLMVHGVSDCVMIYKLSDFFEDKGCLRYIKKIMPRQLNSMRHRQPFVKMMIVENLE